MSGRVVAPGRPDDLGVERPLSRADGCDAEPRPDGCAALVLCEWGQDLRSATSRIRASKRASFPVTQPERAQSYTRGGRRHEARLARSRTPLLVQVDHVGADRSLVAKQPPDGLVQRTCSGNVASVRKSSGVAVQVRECRGPRIAPRLPQVGARTLDLGRTRIVDRASFLDRPRIRPVPVRLRNQVYP
jgi:hypothetical protein